MEIVPGLRKEKNSSGHPVFFLHYSADPAKNEDWANKEATKYVDGGRNSIRWRGEMEMDFEAGSGELVFSTFSAREHEICIDPFKLDETYVLYGGMDWGTRNPTSFHVYAESLDKKFYAVWEYYAERQPPMAVAEAIRACPYYDRLQWIAADPAMFSLNVAKKDGFTSISEMLMDEDTVGVNTIDKLIPAHSRSDETMINVMKNAWAKDKPDFYFFKNCPKLITEIRNLKHPEYRGQTNPTEKIIDKNNHAWDDMKYFRLSHPFAAVVEEKPKFGTVAYLNEISDLAQRAAERSGRSVQEEFNNLWGLDL